MRLIDIFEENGIDLSGYKKHVFGEMLKKYYEYSDGESLDDYGNSEVMDRLLYAELPPEKIEEVLLVIAKMIKLRVFS